MSKTIRQIADEIGVSKQAVQKRLAREPLYTCIQPYISTKERTKYISDEGVKLVKQAFSTDDTHFNVDKVVDNLYTPDVHSLYTSLQQELEHKNRLIEEQQKAILQQQQNINDLTGALKNTTESLQAAHALHAGTISKQIADHSITSAEKKLPENQEPRRKGFLYRIFNKRE